MHSGGEAATGISAVEPADPSIGEQVLLLRVHVPRAVPGWVTPDLFDSEIHQRIFAALAAGAALADLHDVAEGEAAAVVARLAAWEPPENASAVVGRLVYDAAARRIAAMPRTARTTRDADMGRRWVDAQLARDELRAQDWSPAAAERLVGLLDDLARAADLPGDLERPETAVRGGALDDESASTVPEAPPGDRQPPGGTADPSDRGLAASEEERFYEELPDVEAEGLYVAHVPDAGEPRP